MKRRSFLGSLAALIAAPKALLALGKEKSVEMRYRYDPQPIIGQTLTPDVFGGGFRLEVQDSRGEWHEVSGMQGEPWFSENVATNRDLATQFMISHTTIRGSAVKKRQ